MRILQVLRAPVGGLFRHVADLTRGLTSRGHSVGLVLDMAHAGARWEGVIDELQSLCSLGVTRLPMARSVGLSDVQAVRSITQLLQDNYYDVVHGHGAKGGAYARIAGTLARRKLPDLARFYTPHGGSLHFAPRSLEGLVYHTLEKRLASVSEAILFESRFAKQGFAQLCGVDTASYPVIYNGLMDAEFEQITPDSDVQDLVFVGEMRTLKGVDVLLRALALLHSADAPCPTALLVGAGPDEAQFRALAQSLGIAERVRFAAPMPARQAFVQGRLLVAPSRAESLPYLVLEAAAAGLPMIATDVGGIPEIFGTYANRLIAADDVHALSRRIHDELADLDSAKCAAQLIRDHVQHNFNIDRMVDGVLGGYQKTMPAS